MGKGKAKRERRAVAAAATLAPPELATRALDSFEDHPGLTEQLLAVQGLRVVPWAPVGVRDALGIPAVFRAVTLISNLMGTFHLEAWRNGIRMEDPPRLLQRPDPFRTARDYWRDAGWNMATRGECDFYVGARDSDGNVLSLLNVPPAELQGEYVEPRDAVLGRITWTWRGVPVPARDIIQVTFAREGGAARGVGPLQLCGAALSVAAEAEQWAANYYGSGGLPSVLLSPRVPISADDAALMRAAWMAGDPNTPKVAADVDATVLSGNAQQAQLAEARLQSANDVATMFGIAPELLERAMVGGGGSLTYRNLADLGTDLVRFCLVPGYLEPVEQAMSDLVPRSILARFNVDELERADAETRFRIYESGVRSGVLTAEDGQRMEGLLPGASEFAAIPPNLAPATIPAEVH